ncbi:MAG TPA: DUF4870 domain-containing protein [Propioniciclava tarda]|nr:DUF4870 domain-containing protein [Propioniciclava tarda]
MTGSVWGEPSEYVPARAIADAPDAAEDSPSSGPEPVSGHRAFGLDESPTSPPTPVSQRVRSAETPTSPDTPSVLMSLTGHHMYLRDAPDAFAPTLRPEYSWTPQPPAAATAEPAASDDGLRTTSDEERWARAAHWLPLVSHWIGPLVLLLTQGRRSDRVRTEAIHSLNWEITVALLFALAVGVSRFGVIGPALAVGVAVLSVGLHLVGVVTTARGGSFQYPLALPIVR